MILVCKNNITLTCGVWWCNGGVQDSGPRWPGFDAYFSHIVSLGKTLKYPRAPFHSVDYDYGKH